jgi:hypothetical protein
MISSELLESDVAEWAWIRDEVAPRTRCFGKQGTIATMIVLGFWKRWFASCVVR